MGRYNFAPARVHQATTDLLTCGRIQRPPPWYNVIGSVPPPEILVRTPPVQQHSSPPSDQLSRKLQRRKPSKLFKPQRIDYPEDALRREFFKDHPWELARPRLVVESDGCDARRVDWSSIRQSGRPLDGESVIQRQLHLMTYSSLSKSAAYDQARHEFYAERLKEDIERRVAVEEAQSTGAYFGLSYLQIGMQLEDKTYEEWKLWALKDTLEQEQRRAAKYSGNDGAAGPQEAEKEEDGGVEEALDELDAAVVAAAS